MMERLRQFGEASIRRLQIDTGTPVGIELQLVLSFKRTVACGGEPLVRSRGMAIVIEE